MRALSATRRPWAVLAVLALLPIIGIATAGEAYRWKDRAGIVHYGDRAPAAAGGDVRRIPLTTGPHAAVRLRIDNQGDRRYAA